MEMQLFTIHSRGRPNELRVVGDQKRRLGVVPPVWALWHGLWITFAAMLCAFALALWLNPALFGALWGALLLLSTLEGCSIERLELRLRGWREVGMVEARSDIGAEELFLEGGAIGPPAGQGAGRGGVAA